MQRTSSLDAQKRWGWAQNHSPTGGRRMSVLQRLGPGLVPADLLRGFAPEPLGVGHRGREVGLVLGAARGQRPAAPAPESAPRAGGHVRPAGRAGSARGRGRGQGPAEAPCAGDFATLQPRRLHRCRRDRPFLPSFLQAPPRTTRGALATSWGPKESRREAGENPEVCPGPWDFGRHHQSRREKPTWSGGGKLERGRGGGDWWGSPRRGEKPGASAAPRPRREGRPRPDAAEPLRRGPPARPRVFQQTSRVQLLGVGLREPEAGAASPRAAGAVGRAELCGPRAPEVAGCFYLLLLKTKLHPRPLRKQVAPGRGRLQDFLTAERGGGEGGCPTELGRAWWG